jgi:MoaA/NifB/PqqE/SkfB family radical SAM enzyme
MECTFLNHGLQINYSGVVRPCCVLQVDQQYSEHNHVSKVDLVTWHGSNDVAKIKQQLAQNQWPKECSRCQRVEEAGRGDSMRLNSAQSYNHYTGDDLVVELRPGNTCNFACQTCWPQASSRVAVFYQKAGIKFEPAREKSWNYSAIKTVLPRIKDLIILGGEPFYDKKCREFFSWLVQQNAHPRMTMFTNGSMIDFDFLKQYKNHINLVFSLDATGQAAEYIRLGTEWPVVLDNYQRCRSLSNVEVRVNITVSPYNYAYLANLVSLLAQDWPSVVSWENASQSENSKFMSCRTIPSDKKQWVIDMIQPSLAVLERANIEPMQKINAINVIKTTIKDIHTQDYNPQEHEKLKLFINSMDQVKGIDIRDYCPEVANYLEMH